MSSTFRAAAAKCNPALSLPRDLFELTIASFLTVKDMCNWTATHTHARRDLHHAMHAPSSLPSSSSAISASSSPSPSLSFFPFDRYVKSFVRRWMKENNDSQLAAKRWKCNTIQELEQIQSSSSSSGPEFANDAPSSFHSRSLASAPSYAAYSNWQLGTGWRDAYRMWPPVEGKVYYVFEPYWLWVGEEDGILYNGEWFQSQNEQEAQINNSMQQATAAHLSASSLQPLRHLSSSATSTCGSGPAAEIPHTRAVQLPLRFYSRMTPQVQQTELLSPPLPLQSPLFPQITSTILWSPTRLLGFMHAHQSLRAMHRSFLSEQVRVFFNYDLELAAISDGFRGNLLHTPCQQAIEDTFTWPIPFLLPWPIEGEEAEPRTRSSADSNSAGTSIHRTRPRWASTDPIPDELLEQWSWQIETEPIAPSASSSQPAPDQAPIADACPFDRTCASIPPTSTCVSHLSGVVRGCPWVLPVRHADGLGQTVQTRVEEEMSLIARRIARQLGLFPSLRADMEQLPAAAVSVNEFRHGVRSFSQSSDSFDEVASAAEGNDALDAHDSRLRWFKHCRLQGSVGDSGELLPLTAALSSSLSRLLPSSFIVSMGPEHLTPWPALIVAPIAPGWVGGFIAGANTLH